MRNYRQSAKDVDDCVWGLEPYFRKLLAGDEVNMLGEKDFIDWGKSKSEKEYDLFERCLVVMGLNCDDKNVEPFVRLVGLESNLTKGKFTVDGCGLLIWLWTMPDGAVHTHASLAFETLPDDLDGFGIKVESAKHLQDLFDEVSEITEGHTKAWRDEVRSETTK